MTDHSFAPIGDDDPSDDLPRTFRREKEARAREARERAAQERASAPSLSTDPEPRYQPAPQMDSRSDLQPVVDDATYPVTVRNLDVPFFQLARFLIKAVLAGVPALIMLGVILWCLGAVLQSVFPELIKMKILISFPN